MKPARLIVMSIALVAAVAAGYLILNVTSQSTDQPVRQVVKKVKTETVLVASSSLPIGSRLNNGNLDWQDWPEHAVTDGYITRSTRPDAIVELTDSIVRLPVFEGEPVRTEKIVDAGTRIMSSMLPSGKRAVSTEISVETSAGGFILPNDRVDVIMVRNTDETGFLTETILSNIRVLAIDQRIQEDEDGKKTAVGTTATLELNPDQAKIISVAQQMASRLTLALRSVADAQEADTGGADHLLSGDGGASIQLIRSGQITTIGAN
ncbi:MAG: Flp pilus assembly protein CpaB [Hyphomicrobiales bacterium]|nr:Flp pilus assembly protein CpaB [Hyphomicrobiales bacterium]MCP4999869.1 Flp pilus assembly protein CpaB [Hyphomicrobiales bacterium]